MLLHLLRLCSRRFKCSMQRGAIVQSQHKDVHQHSFCRSFAVPNNMLCPVACSPASGAPLIDIVWQNACASNTPRQQKHRRHSSSATAFAAAVRGSGREDWHPVSALETGVEAFDREEQRRYQVGTQVELMLAIWEIQKTVILCLQDCMSSHAVCSIYMAMKMPQGRNPGYGREMVIS